MSSTTPLIERVADPALAEPPHRHAVPAGTDRAVFAATMLALTVLYLLLQNPYWVPGGDAEVYVAIARNLATGQGLLFNGQPVGMFPPGWSILLAGVMLISPTFLAMKLVTLVSMLVALGACYWILRRYASPLVSAACVLISGVLSHTYSLTFWLHSDAFYFTLSALAILVALQINEGKPLGWRLPLLLLLCIAGVFIRWQAVLNWMLVAAVLVQGQLLPRPDRRWLALVLSGAVTAGTFWMMPRLMKAMAPPPVQFAEGFEGEDMAPIMMLDEGEGAIIPGADDWVAQGYTIAATGADMPPFFRRAISWGVWFSYLFWQPLRLGASWHTVWLAAAISGWILIAVLLVAAGRDLLAKRWLLAVLMLYTLALSLRWTQPNARYLVSLAPFIFLGLFHGVSLLRGWLMPAIRHAMRAPADDGDNGNGAHSPVLSYASGQYSLPITVAQVRRWAASTIGVAMGLFIASVLLVNLALYGVEVSVMRSGTFYDRYEAGLNKGLVAVAQYLDKVGVGHGQVAVNPQYVNLGRRRISHTGLRGYTMLTGKAMVSVPRRYLPKNLPRYTPFRIWIGENRIVYYVDQPAISPWRVWHFRLPWLQQALTGREPEDTGAGWRLYRCDGKSIPLRVRLDDEIEYVTRVPGL